MLRRPRTFAPILCLLFLPGLTVAAEPLPDGALLRLGESKMLHDDDSPLLFSPDGKVLASVGRDNTVRLWDPRTGREVRRIGGEHDSIRAFAFSPDGKTLASAGPLGHVDLWNTTTGELRRTVPLPESLVGRGYDPERLAFTPDGKLLALGAWKDMLLWDVATGKQLQRFAVSHFECDNFALSPDGKRLFTASDRFQKVGARVWDVATGKEVRRFDRAGNNVVAFAFFPDGKRFATGGSDAVRVWDLESGKELLRLPRGAVSLALSPDGKTLALGTEYNTVHVWDLPAEREVYTLRGHGQPVHALAFSPDGKSLASGAQDGTICLWDLATGANRAATAGHRTAVISAAFSPGGKMLVSLGGDNSVRLWDTATGRELQRHHLGHTPFSDWRAGQPNELAFAPDGRTFAAAGYDRWGRVWDVATGKERCRLGREYQTDAIVYSPDGKMLATGGSDWFSWCVHLWDLDGKEVRRLPMPALSKDAHSRVECLAFSPDGKTLAAGGYDDLHRREKPAKDRPPLTLRLYNVAAGKEIAALSPYSERVLSLAFGADGRSLVTLGADMIDHEAEARALLEAVKKGKDPPKIEGRPLRTWDMTARRETIGPKGNDELTDCVVVSADGQLGAALDRNGEVYLWEALTGREFRPLARPQGKTLALALSKDGRMLAAGGSDGSLLLYDLRTLTAAKGAAPADLESAWTDLAKDDPAVAWRALGVLAASPKAVSFLKDRLRPAHETETRPVARLIAELDAEEFAVREAASRQLEKAGADVVPALRQALEGKPSAEAQRRLETLLGVFQRQPFSPQTVRDVRALRALTQAGTPEARTLLKTLAEGAPASVLTRYARAALAAWSTTQDEKVPAPLLPAPDRPAPLVAEEVRRFWGHRSWMPEATFWEHMDQVHVLTFSADGKALLTGGLDGTVRLWDPRTGKELRTLTLPKGRVLCAAFAPDGKAVAAAGDEGIVRLWDTATGAELRHWEADKGPVPALAFAPDGKRLATGNASGTVRLWDAAAGKELRSWTMGQDIITALAFPPDGKALAVSTGILPNSGMKKDASTHDFRQVHAGAVRLWDPDTAKELRKLAERGSSLIFSHDGKLLATAGVREPALPREPRQQPPEIVELTHLWDAASGRRLAEVPGSLAALSPDGKWLVVRSSGMLPEPFGWTGNQFADPGHDTLCVVEASTGRVVQHLREQSGLTAAFSPDGKLLATASLSGVVSVWSLAER